MLHAAAAGASGVLVLGAYGEKGGGLPPLNHHFEVGAVERMADTAVQLNRQPGRNVYAGWATMRGLRPNAKGGEADIEYVLGLVADFDLKSDLRAGDYLSRLPLAPNAVIETSAGSFQCVYVFDRPATVDAAKPVARALAEATGCDRATKDLAHVWRPAGLLNYPDAGKIAAGRDPVPFVSRFAKRWDGSLTNLADLKAALDVFAAEPSAPPLAANDDSFSPDPISLGSLPRSLRELITEGVPVGERSGQFYRVVAELKERGHGAVAVAELLAEHPTGIAEKYRGRISEEVLRVFNKGPDRSTAKDDFNPERPTIKVTAGNLHNLATEAEAALLASGAPYYVRGSRIVRPVVDDLEASHGRRTRVARLVDVTPDMLIDQLSRSATWTRYDARRKKAAPIDPPRQVAQVLLSRDGEWRLPRLSAVLTTPTLRPDGSLLAEAGYDPSTRILLIDPPELPGMPQHPTKEDALAALGRLDALLDEFAFVDAASRSVALSALISPVVRGALSAVPLHATTAPAAGSGKSFLFDVVAALAIGSACPVIAAGSSEEELEKRIDAALLKGQPLLSVDNVNGELRGDKLCQAVERPVVEVRRLGASEIIRIESRTTLFASGINLTIAGDLVRRTLLCSLDAELERPELRQFKRIPTREVLENRGQYLADALTVVRAYKVAGCPDQLPDLASFESWSRLVRGALVWLGRADPCDTAERLRSEDPELSAIRQVIAAWPVKPGMFLTTAKLLDAAMFPADGTDATFQQALQLATGTPHRAIDGRTLGYWLRANKGRVVSGVKITRTVDRHTNQAAWGLQPVAGDGR